MEWTDKDVRTWKRNDADGVYYVIVPGTAKWRSSGQTRKSLAIEWALREANGGSLPTDTFGEYAKDFFVPGICRRVSLIESTKGKNTIDHWDQLRQILVDYVMPRWEKTPMAMIAPAEVFRWLNDPQLTTLRKSAQAPRPLSTVWRNRILTVMTQVYEQALFEQVLPGNPMKSVPRLTLVTKKQELFSDAEMATLFPRDEAVLDKLWGGRAWAVLAMVLADTGMRPGEGLALSWKNWYPEDKALIIGASVTSKGKIGPLKTAKRGIDRRVGVVSERTSRLLNQLKGQAKPDELIFPSTKFEKTRGQPMRTETMTHHFERVLAKAAIDRRERTLYCLRHTANTGFRTDLGDEATRLLMGHTTKKMTEHYDHPEDKDLIARAVRATAGIGNKTANTIAPPSGTDLEP